MANRRFIDFPIASTVGDNDIILIWQDGLNKQTTKATILTGISQDLASLTDVDLTGLTNGQILRYNSVTSKWENTDQGNLDLNDLNDVTIVSPSNGQVLVYNSSTSKWENSSGGYVPYIGAVTTVDLGAQQLQAGHTTLTTNGSTETLTINHTSGSGKAINVTKGGAGEGLYVNKTSGSGNAATIVGTLEATTLKKTGGTSSQFLKADGSVDSTTYQNTADKGQPNGYASLDGNGKVPLTQINDALIGNVNFQGLWNASTNTPTLVDPPSSGTKGYYYIVSTGGTFAGITFEVGDWIISNGTAWGKVDNTDAVSSVFGRTGNVVASNGDYNTSQVTESGNLYYTDARSRAALSFAAGSGAYNSGTGVITIPTNNNQITNGAGYITSYTETDTLATVVSRGASTTQTISVGNDALGTTGINIRRGRLSFSDYYEANHSIYNNYRNIDGEGSFDGMKINCYAGLDIRTDDATTPTTIFSLRNTGLVITGNLTVNGIYYVPASSYFIGGSNGFRFNSNDDAFNNFIIYDNGNTLTRGSSTANSFIKSGGTSSQYLMADGSVSTLTNPVTGSGTTNYLPKFTGASTIGNSLLSESGTGRINLYASSGFAELYVKGSGSTSGMYLFDQNTESGLWKVDSGYMAFATTNIEAMRIFSGQNVHIGPTPASDNGARLQVSGTATVSGLLSVMSHFAIYSDSEFMGALGFNRNPATGAIYNNSRAAFQLQNNLGTFQFRAFSSAGSDLGTPLSISSTGAATFSNSVTANGMTLLNSGGTYLNYYVSTYLIGRIGNVDTNDMYYDSTFGGNHYFRTGTGGTTSPTTKFTIASNGNVGIGTTSYTVSSGYTGLGINNATNGGVLDLLLNDVKKGEFYITSSSFNMYGFSGVGINLTVNNDVSKNLSIATTGSVGIGTNTPVSFQNYKYLQITGTNDTQGGVVRLTTSLGTYNAEFYTESSGSYLASSGLLGFYSAGGQRMTITSSGNVGINTTSPRTGEGTPLTIESSTGYVGISLSGTGSYANVWQLYASGDGASNKFFGIYDRTNNAYRLVTTSSGNVGINTTSPTWLLEVNKDTTSGSTGGYPAVSVNNPNANGYGAFYFYQGASQKGGIEYFNGDSTFRIYNAGEKMRITSSGNVLVGTTTDTGGVRFQVAASASSWIGATISGDGGTDKVVIGNYGVASIGGHNSALNAWANLAINFDGGNVLIGTRTDNGNKLRVNGDLWVDGIYRVPVSSYFISGSAGFRFNNSTDAFNNFIVYDNGNTLTRGSSTATSFFESSDASLKTLVADNYQTKGIDSVVAKLYIKNGKEELGYYAQDLQGVLPSAVSKGSDGLLNLSYREVHTAKIAYLEEKIKQLENELGRISK
jgi:hypothetical protein